MATATSVVTDSGICIEDYHVLHGGARLHLITAGEATAPPVVLLHGRSHDATLWQELGTIEMLARRGYRAIAMDLPGYGTTDGLKFSPNTFLFECLPALEIERPLVVAPSLAGRYALPMAVRYPDQVSGLVLVAPMAAESFGPRLVESTIKTLIVWGEDDWRFPLEIGEGLHLQLPASRLVVIDNSGHACHAEDPDTFHAHLLPFVAEIYGVPNPQGLAEEVVEEVLDLPPDGAREEPPPPEPVQPACDPL